MLYLFELFKGQTLQRLVNFDVRQAGTGQIAQALWGCHSMNTIPLHQEDIIWPNIAFRGIKTMITLGKRNAKSKAALSAVRYESRKDLAWMLCVYKH